MASPWSLAGPGFSGIASRNKTIGKTRPFGKIQEG
jgi:hypothetical protein